MSISSQSHQLFPLGRGDVREVGGTTSAAPGSVFAVLSDGWLYPTWVVGASRARRVDLSWPEPGSRIHHSFGIWPFVLDDISESRDCEPDRRLVVRPKGWPLGEALVEIRVDGWDSGSVISIREDVVSGPGRLVPQALRQLVIAVRNVETLRRLALIAEGREHALYLAIDIVRRGGTISVSGVYGGAADPLPLLTMFDKQIQLRMGQANVHRWVPDILPLLTDDDPLGVDSFVTHALPLSQAPAAYEMFQKKQDGAIKVVFRP